MRMSEDQVCPSLDCAVHIKVDSSLKIKIYRKPTQTHLYLLVDSHHPLEHKLGVIRTLHNLAQNIPTRGKSREPSKPVATLAGPSSNFQRKQRRISQKREQPCYSRWAGRHLCQPKKFGGLRHHPVYNTVSKNVPSKRGPSQMATNKPHCDRGSFDDPHSWLLRYLI